MQTSSLINRLTYRAYHLKMLALTSPYDVTTRELHMQTGDRNIYTIMYNVEHKILTQYNLNIYNQVLPILK